MAERFKAAVLKTAEVMSLRGFESHPLRHFVRTREALRLSTAGQGLGFGEVLDAGFQVFRAAFWQLALAQAIIAVPVAIIQAIWLPSTMPGDPLQATQLFLARAPLSLLIGVLGILQAGAVAGVAQQAAHGGEASAFKAYRQAISRFPELLGWGLVYGVVVGIGLLIVIVPGIVAAVWLSQGLFLVVLGGRGIAQGVVESYRIVAGRFWRVLGIALVAFLMVAVVSLLVAILIPVSAGRGGVTDVVTTLVGILIGSFPLVALYIQYRDLLSRPSFVAARPRD